MQRVIPETIRDSTYWLHEYRTLGALFVHDRKACRPHPVLRFGEHSDVFFNSDILAENPTVTDKIAADLVSAFFRFNIQCDHVQRVVGPAMGAITLAHDVARHIAKYSSKGCFTSFVEKGKDGDNNDVMVFNRRGVLPHEHILLVEDVITSGSSIEKTARAVHDGGANTLPFVVCIVNRSGLPEIAGRQIISLIDGSYIDKMTNKWKPEKCELCKIGSQPLLDPKKDKNWQRLIVKY